MAHEAHHDSHHTGNESNKTQTSSRASFWFVVILVGLFIAAVNFVTVMSHDDGGGHGGHGTEHAAPAHETHADGHHAEAAHEEAGHEEAHH